MTSAIRLDAFGLSCMSVFPGPGMIPFRLGVPGAEPAIEPDGVEAGDGVGEASHGVIHKDLSVSSVTRRAK